MALYSYKKKPVGAQRRYLTLISYSTMTIGALFLFWSLYPIVASELYGRIFIDNAIIAPIPSTFAATSVDKTRGIKGTSTAFSTNLIDYTQASSWFINAPAQDINHYDSDIKEYFLTIPKLGIENVRVIVGGDDLLDGLIHYLPDGLPGSDGTVHIFGHSTHTSLYRKNNLKSIFTFLPSLQVGDIFYITVDGVRFTYEVYDRVIIKPTDVAALQPKYDDSYVNLFTCVPVGTYNNRLQVKARLQKLPIL
jgi:sortase A